jgi:hypothetical protein
VDDGIEAESGEAMIDYQTMSNDIKTRVATVAAPGPVFNKVFNEMDGRERAFHNMPLANVRWAQDTPEVRAGQDYVVMATFEIEIVAHSLRTRLEAATIRDQLLFKTRNVLRAGPASSLTAQGESIVLGPAQPAEIEQDEKEGGFVASVTMAVTVIVFADRS